MNGYFIRLATDQHVLNFYVTQSSTICPMLVNIALSLNGYFKRLATDQHVLNFYVTQSSTICPMLVNIALSASVFSICLLYLCAVCCICALYLCAVCCICALYLCAVCCICVLYLCALSVCYVLYLCAVCCICVLYLWRLGLIKTNIPFFENEFCTHSRLRYAALVLRHQVLQRQDVPQFDSRSSASLDPISTRMSS